MAPKQVLTSPIAATMTIHGVIASDIRAGVTEKGARQCTFMVRVRSLRHTRDGDPIYNLWKVILFDHKAELALASLVRGAAVVVVGEPNLATIRQKCGDKTINTQMLVIAATYVAVSVLSTRQQVSVRLLDDDAPMPNLSFED